MRSRYYGTAEALGFQEALAAYRYLTSRIDRTILRHGRFLIDTDALLVPVNLDCFHCHLVHGQTCCEQGQPYSMTGANLSQFEAHALPILERHAQDERLGIARKHGIFEATAATNHHSCIRKFAGDCLYLVKQDEKHLCAIHRYALEEEIEPAQLKPFSCSLFPLEIIEMDEGILLTAVTPDTMDFSRWGDFYHKHYSCVNPARRPKETPAHYFAARDYRPAWLWARDLLVSYWGEADVASIESKLPLPV